MNLNWLSSASEGAQLLVSLIVAFCALMSALSLLLGFIGHFWAPALKAAAWCGKAGIELHQLGAWLASAIPTSSAAGQKRGFMRFGPMLALALVGLFVAGCAAFAAAAEYIAPIVVGASCSLAADQGAAEPGWEIWTCAVLDPSSGKPTGATFQMHCPKGTKMISRAR